MKKLSRIKLNELSQLARTEMKNITGGGIYGPNGQYTSCACGCNYANTPGGSSNADNGIANAAKGLDSYNNTGSTTSYWFCETKDRTDGDGIAIYRNPYDPSLPQ